MSVLQLAKHSVTVLAAVSVALTGCGDSGPDVPFNPAGTSADMEAMNTSFASPVFGSFATFSLQFDAALGTAPLISASAQALDFRRATTVAGLRAAARRNAQRVAGLAPKLRNQSFSASSAAIPAEVAGKTFEYVDGSYVPGDRLGAPTNGVRFLIYAVNPVTWEPVLPLQEVGYVELTDLSGSSTQAARVVVVSGETTYLDYTVSSSAGATSGLITVAGFVTDGTIRANLNLRATVTQAAGLTLAYTVDVPQRDLSIDLSMTMTGLDPQSGTMGINLSVSGPNGRISMFGELTEAGGTLTVRVNGATFAAITSNGTAEPVITGPSGQPLSDDEAAALQRVFEVTGEAFTSFDVMIAPVGAFMEPA